MVGRFFNGHFDFAFSVSASAGNIRGIGGVFAVCAAIDFACADGAVADRVRAVMRQIRFVGEFFRHKFLSRIF